MANNLARSSSSIQKVALGKIRVSPAAQRELRQEWVDALVANFDPEALSHPTLNLRSGHYYAVDGQHRIAAVKQWLGDGWERQNIDCRVFVGLTEREEAALFLELNSVKAVTQFDKFKVAVTAGSSDECTVKQTVETCGLRISREKRDGNVGCVGTLLRVYRRSDARTLGRAITIAHESFGHQGMTNQVVDGIAMICERYNGELRDKDAIDQLRDMRGGVGALINRANVLRNQTAQSVPVCVAAATVEVLNRRRGGKKLPSWWAD